MSKADNYVKCGWRRVWMMWDLDNGHARHANDTGKGYVWLFASRKEARKHRKMQHKKKTNARLSQPFMVEGDRRYP